MIFSNPFLPPRNLFVRVFAASLLFSLPADAGADERPPSGIWGNQGNGSFVNPVLPGDFSDLDAISEGSQFTAITSTMQFSPGMTVLTSRDLVTWKIVGNAVDDLTKIGPELNWDRMNRPGRGVWAGSIRRHADQYWIYFGTPDEGYFVTTAPAPEGPWTPPASVIKGRGWDDCCPFWDDDGQGWFIGTNFGQGYAIWLWKMTPNGKGIVPASGRIVYRSKGSEANKLFKHDGWYFHCFSEVHQEGRVAMIRRAKSLDGPWETRQLNHSRPVDPNQGGFVTSPDGSWWFFTHFGSGQWSGRQANVLPVHWIDGYPIIGAPDASGIGDMVWRAKLPISPADPPSLPVANDTFNAPSLNPCWQWNYQPRAGFWSLTERPGFLRLKAFPPLQRAGTPEILRAGNTVTQRSFATAENTVTVAIDIPGMADGQKAGLCHFGPPWSTIGVEQTERVRRIFHTCNSGKRDEADARTPGAQVTGNRVWFRSTWDANGTSKDSYSLDGTRFDSLGGPIRLGFAGYRGDHVGLYSYNPVCEAGFVDIDSFRYETAPPSGPHPVKSNLNNSVGTIAISPQPALSAVRGGDNEGWVGGAVPKLPALKPLLDVFMRDPNICRGPNGVYYLMGTTGDWAHSNRGIEMWQSPDLAHWTYSGLIWTFANDAKADWQKGKLLADGTRQPKALWAPELHYIKGTWYIAYCIEQLGCGVLKSASGQPEGPYVDVKSDGPIDPGYDASLFEDDDGKVYFLTARARIARMKEDMSGLAEPTHPVTVALGTEWHVTEGPCMAKLNGRYYLFLAQGSRHEKDGERAGAGATRTYDVWAMVADSPYGPYRNRHLAFPSAGHNTVFGDNNGHWWSTWGTSDRRESVGLPFWEKPAIIPIEMDTEGRLRPSPLVF